MYSVNKCVLSTKKRGAGGEGIRKALLLFIEYSELINVEGMIDFRNHHFLTPVVIINSDKGYQWVLKLLG